METNLASPPFLDVSDVLVEDDLKTRRGRNRVLELKLLKVSQFKRQ